MTRFCGNKQRAMDSRAGPWRHTIRIAVKDPIPGFDLADSQQILVSALSAWQPYGQFEYQLIDQWQRANIVLTTENIPDHDPGEVLAQAELPPPDPHDDIQLRIWIDSGDKWQLAFPTAGDRFNPQQVLTHEVGHTLGLEHAPNAINLMSPTISEIRAPQQDWDIPTIRQLYEVTTTDPGDQKMNCDTIIKLLPVLIDCFSRLPKPERDQAMIKYARLIRLQVDDDGKEMINEAIERLKA